MSEDATELDLATKQAVEQTITTIYSAGYQRELDLTHIDQAVDLIRAALGIDLVDCQRCGETILSELAQVVRSEPGPEGQLCYVCARCDEAKPLMKCDPP